MQVLVDSSIWIDYFRTGAASSELDTLINENIIVTNDIILAELIPFLRMKKQDKVIALLEAVNKNRLTVNWQEIIHFQTQCLAAEANGMGIPDLIIAQNALQNDCAVYSLDKHFQQLQRIIQVNLFPSR
jgi:predicted nucleic acid-binding protein